MAPSTIRRRRISRAPVRSAGRCWHSSRVQLLPYHGSWHRGQRVRGSGEVVAGGGSRRWFARIPVEGHDHRVWAAPARVGPADRGITAHGLETDARSHPGLGRSVIATPILVGVALAMRLSGDRGPFLYRATRVGEGARLITILKVRTMADGSGGSRLTLARDPRVTPLGRLIRRSRIDELPQLIGVLRGDLSLVGPRPEDPHYVDLSNPLNSARLLREARDHGPGPARVPQRGRTACRPRCGATLP